MRRIRNPLALPILTWGRVVGGCLPGLVVAGLGGPVAAEPLGSDAEACGPAAAAHGDAPTKAAPAALVTVTGFKDRSGNLRLQYYTGDKASYLASGRYLRRQELRVTPAGAMAVCITLPAPGAYAMVALHDRDADGKLSIWSDGIGFSNNPRLGLSKPPAARTLAGFGPGVTPITIVLNYRQGLAVRPLK